MSYTVDTTDSPRTPRKRSPWPFAIAGLLAAHVGAMVLAVQIAGRSGGHALLPEYRDRALDWDAARAAAAASEALGWTLDVAPAALGDGAGLRRVTLTLRDSAGDPVVGADVQVRCYHLAVGERSDVAAAADDSGEPGRYSALVPLERPGDYSLETRAVLTLPGSDTAPLAFQDTRIVHIVGLAATPPRGGAAR